MSLQGHENEEWSELGRQRTTRMIERLCVSKKKSLFMGTHTQSRVMKWRSIHGERHITRNTR
jgi:hypothetical protein